jgi:diguanylate cyclase (GGDEF)-like protein
MMDPVTDHAPQDASFEAVRASIPRDPGAALEACRAAMRDLESSARNSPEVRGSVARWRFLEGKCLQTLSEFDAAEASFASALEVFEEIGDDEGMASSINGLGAVAMAHGDWDTAFERFRASLARHRAAGREQLSADLLNNLAATHHRVGQYAQSLELQLEALEIQRRLGDRLGEAKSLFNIGLTHIELGDHERCIECLERSLVLHETLDHPMEQAAVLNALAGSLQALDRLEEVPAVLRKALELAQQLGDRAFQSMTWLNLGSAYRKLQRPDDARDALQRGVRIAREVQDLEFICAGLAELARFSLEGGQVHEALGHAEEALRVSLEVNLPDFEAKARLVLSEIAETLEDWRSALTHLKRLRELDDAISRQRGEERARQLSQQFQTAQAKRDADLERDRSAALRDLNAALETANAEKAELLLKLEERNARLERQSLEDVLTGLGNRRFLEASLEREAERSRRVHKPLSLAILDLDHFKAINDSYSHQIGDVVLQTLAVLLRSQARASDVIARYGGEEFVILCPDTDASRANGLCERLRHAVETHDWERLAPDLKVTVSIGLGSAEDAASLETLFASADAALYRAKREGRNRVR